MLFFLILGLLTLLVLPRLILGLVTNPQVFAPANAPTRRVAIVFGAGLRRDGSPSPVLEDRVSSAADLYFAGKVAKLLMSGDNRFLNYNEPAAMLNYALKLGVPREDIVLDYAGRRTYDTCYRAKSIFGVDQALLVTQKFHLARAVFTCNAIGLPAEGVIADRRPYFGPADLREYPASWVAFWDVWFAHPLPVMGPPEPIFSHLLENRNSPNRISQTRSGPRP